MSKKKIKLKKQEAENLTPDLIKNLEKILTEDNELLKRLAQ